MNVDELYMQRALDLARLGGVDVAPNPMVGAVIVHHNRVIGEGWHRQFGEPHAEVNAVNAVENQELLEESTIYVTLEPCAHTGKTPPCADLLISKKLKRVVIGTIDPFAKVAGQGIKRLEKSGIETTVGVLEQECREMNKRFFTYHKRQRPYVILKWVQTKDGYLDAGHSDEDKGSIHWISSPETQALVHHWRSQEQAILVGWKTVLNDDPSLTVREVKGNDPLRIIIDGQLKAPIHAKLLTDNRPTLIINTLRSAVEGPVTFLKVPAISTTEVLKALYDRQLISVLIEGGSRTLQHFIVDQAWDEARVILGRTTFGSGTKAPLLPLLPARTFDFSTDRVFEYRKL